MASALESSVQVYRLFWFGIIFGAVFILGLLLAYASYTAFVVVFGLLAFMLLPYHSKIAIRLALATFSSALILPFFPGRPFFWEFGGMLGWSGLLVVISLRTYAPNSLAIMRKHKWIFVGIVLYCTVLLVTMFYRGFGLRIFGSQQIGGRFYIQQLICAVFPFLFVMCPLSEKQLTRLLAFQFLLTGTFIISDLTFSVGTKELWVLLQFFELPGDAFNFERQAMHFGIRRFQSMQQVGQGLLMLILMRYPLREFFGRRGVWLTPVALATLAFGTLSGHRILFITSVGVLLTIAVAQKFFSPRNLVITLTILGSVLVTVYSISDHLPLAAQRAASFLPGINIQSLAADDGYGTLVTRKMLRKLGVELMPEYFWIGRGFGHSPMGDYSWDPTGLMFHLANGVFYNGFVGLMVNTGVFGTISMLILIFSGTALAFRVIGQLRRLGCQDTFLRACGIISGLWMVTTFSFLFLHGDSEYAMKSFSLQAGTLLISHYHLIKREQEARARQLAAAPISPAQERFEPLPANPISGAFSGIPVRS